MEFIAKIRLKDVYFCVRREGFGLEKVTMVEVFNKHTDKKLGYLKIEIYERLAVLEDSDYIELSYDNQKG